jgi:hypothetical protein
MINQLPTENFLNSLYDLALKHLVYCPNCRAHHLARLEAWAARLAAHNEAG